MCAHCIHWQGSIQGAGKAPSDFQHSFSGVVAPQMLHSSRCSPGTAGGSVPCAPGPFCWVTTGLFSSLSQVPLSSRCTLFFFILQVNVFLLYVLELGIAGAAPVSASILFRSPALDGVLAVDSLSGPTPLVPSPPLWAPEPSEAQ